MGLQTAINFKDMSTLYQFYCSLLNVLVLCISRYTARFIFRAKYNLEHKDLSDQCGSTDVIHVVDNRTHKCVTLQNFTTSE